MEPAALPLDRGAPQDHITPHQRGIYRVHTADVDLLSSHEIRRRGRETDSLLPLVSATSASPRLHFGHAPLSMRRTTYQGIVGEEGGGTASEGATRRRTTWFRSFFDEKQRLLASSRNAQTKEKRSGGDEEWIVRWNQGKQWILSLMVNFTSGVIAFLLSATLAVSCASVVVGHNTLLSTCLAHFIDINLLSTAIFCIVLAWKSQAPWTLGSIDVFVIPVMAQMADRISQSEVETLREIVPTTIICAALTSILLGICLYLMGVFRLTSIANYAPYPVVAGFLAGIGASLVKNGIHMASSMPHNSTREAISIEKIALLIPAVLFAAIARVGQYLKWPVAISFPCLLIASVAGFHLIATVWLRSTVQELGALGWVFSWDSEMVKETPMWFTWTEIKFSDIRWEIFLKECFGYLLTVLILGALKFSVSTTSLSTLFDRDISPDNEMRVIGVANILSGLSGGFAGCHYLSAMGIMKQFEAHEKVPALICAFFLLILWMQGIGILQYVPKFVFGGLLLNVGVHFLEAYLITPMQFLKKLELLLVILITSSFLVIGMLESVGFGIFISIIDLIYRIHQVGCIHHETTGVLARSAVDRTTEQTAFLDKEGSSIFILRLQGYLFFGTSVNILERIKTRMQSISCARKLKYVIIDFGLVPSFDATALINFRKASMYAEICMFEIFYCGMRQSIEKALRRNPSSIQVHFVDGDVDIALEMCENDLLPVEMRLRNFGTVADWKRISHLHLWEKFIEYNDEGTAQLEETGRKYLLPLAAYLDAQILRKGEVLSAKTLAKDTFFICFGHIDVFQDSEFSNRNFIPGVWVPELGKKGDQTRGQHPPSKAESSSTRQPDARRPSLLDIGKEPKWMPFKTSRSRLRKIGPGSIITPHTMTNARYSHCAQSDCVLLRLREESLQNLQNKAPHTAVEVFKLINKQLAGQFLHANKRVSQLSSLLYK